MNRYINGCPAARLKAIARVAILLVLAVAASGCGWIADKDRILVAKWDDRIVRRGDLKRIIRNMPDNERPIVQNRGDLLRTLNRYIDDEIKSTLAARLVGEGKIQVNRDTAKQIYFAKNPDKMNIYNIQDPSVLGLTEADVRAFQAEIEFGIDDEEQKLLREQALTHAASEAVQAGLLTITDQEFEQEYALRGTDFKNFERIQFIAIRFPAASPNAISEAANARRRINNGEPFAQVVESYARLDPSLVLPSEFENNPASKKFAAFWSQVSGCKTGDTIGPIFLPAYDVVRQARDGTQTVIPMPKAHLILLVEDHQPETEKTLEEAKPFLAPGILIRKMIDQLRDDSNVQVFEEDLYDPAGYGDQFKDSFIRAE